MMMTNALRKLHPYPLTLLLGTTVLLTLVPTSPCAPIRPHDPDSVNEQHQSEGDLEETGNFQFYNCCRERVFNGTGEAFGREWCRYSGVPGASFEPLLHSGHEPAELDSFIQCLVGDDGQGNSTTFLLTDPDCDTDFICGKDVKGEEWIRAFERCQRPSRLDLLRRFAERASRTNSTGHGGGGEEVDGWPVWAWIIVIVVCVVLAVMAGIALLVWHCRINKKTTDDLPAARQSHHNKPHWSRLWNRGKIADTTPPAGLLITRKTAASNSGDAIVTPPIAVNPPTTGIPPLGIGKPSSATTVIDHATLDAAQPLSFHPNNGSMEVLRDGEKSRPKALVMASDGVHSEPIAVPEWGL